MKKLMIAAAIVCAVACVHAATIVWGGAADTQEGSPFNSTQTAMLLYSSTEFTGAATEIDGITVGSKANNGGEVIATTTLGAGYEDSEEFYASNPRDWSVLDGYYAILIANENGTSTTYTDMGSYSGATEKTTSIDLKYNEAWGEGYDKYLGENGYTVAVGAVPEPTSGLLLLLGVAGLALMRKRA